MPKPLDQIRPIHVTDRGVSVSDENAIRAAVKDLVRLAVAAPLELTAVAGMTTLRLNGKVLPPGQKGEILYHDGVAWIVLPVPGYNAVLYF
ncbi:unnamed protein product, partial [marine sediment metagenome]